MHVGAQVQLHEIRDSWYSGKEARPNFLHEEGDDAEIGLTGESIDKQSIRQRRLNRFDWVLPVQKKQVAPLLEHNRLPRRSRASR